MDGNELPRRLRAQGWNVTETKVNRAGQLVHRLDHEGFSVVMFHKDAVDLVQGRAELEAILERNKGADFAGPWVTRY